MIYHDDGYIIIYLNHNPFTHHDIYYNGNIMYTPEDPCMVYMLTFGVY